ncbi:putative Xaa-Pro aminopeptidase 3 [Armadillidium nasatum]|uniref:Putative Xaa-Pro aminopeptidase 3 n=1 Tax=Armadillidium nasatum TaxID=96803 RepID=A0A5N5SZ06_9CRUS|nr:putative Xaa-Pro aminopeptidase 3 [Armadillidium nasatum]
MNFVKRLRVEFPSFERKVFQYYIKRLTSSSSNSIGEKEKRKEYVLPSFSEDGNFSKQSTHSGQPTPSSHPHILRKGEVTGGIIKEEYINRQFRLMDLLNKKGSKKDHHIVILPGMPRRYMIDKIPFLFRQDTDMLYLSGCLEPDCVLVLHTVGNSSGNYKALIFTPPYDPSKELWDGPRTSPSGAPNIWGVNEGLPIPELPRYLSSVEKELHSLNVYHHTDPLNLEIHNLLKDWFSMRSRNMQSPKEFIHALRVVKSPAEINLMRETCRISAESIKATISGCRVPTYEHHLYATVDYHCRMRGAEYLAYPPVIAGGSRANIIHNISNNNIVHPGELVLMDAGSEFRGYSGDVTRVWPVSKEFTPGQRDLYEAVLDVQKHTIAACAERPSLNQLFTLMCSRLGSALQELCILPKSLSDSQLSRAAYGFCPHHVSHYLGMDVHDTPLIPKSNNISVGSIITVEPGVYISEKNTAVDPRYLGIGIRLEDDVLICDDCVEVLTNACPKHPDEN